MLDSAPDKKRSAEHTGEEKISRYLEYFSAAATAEFILSAIPPPEPAPAPPEGISTPFLRKNSSAEKLSETSADTAAVRDAILKYADSTRHHRPVLEALRYMCETAGASATPRTVSPRAPP